MSIDIVPLMSDPNVFRGDMLQRQKITKPVLLRHLFALSGHESYQRGDTGTLFEVY